MKPLSTGLNVVTLACAISCTSNFCPLPALAQPTTWSVSATDRDSCATRNVRLADFNGDGLLDLFTANKHDRSRLYLNSGGADPFPALQGFVIDSPGHTVGAQVGDVDGDGDLDIITVNYLGNQHRLFLNNGTPAPFAGVIPDAIAADQGSSHASALVDLNGDGRPDLVLGAYNINGQALIYFNNGTAHPFAGVSGTPVTETRHDHLAIVAADVNGDGRLDLFVGVTAGSPSMLYINNGTRNPFAGVSGQIVTVDGVGGDTGQSALVADFTGDAKPDLIFSSPFGSQPNLRLYANTRSPEPFAGAYQVVAAGAFGTIAAADLDRDGDTDLVAQSYPHPTRVWLNNGSAVPFAAVQPLELPLMPTDGSPLPWFTGLDIGDVDLDGDLDIVSGVYFQPNRLYQAGPPPPPEPCPGSFVDDFDDGVIDSARWFWGGARRGVGGFGSGGWQWSHEEILAPDGYLRVRVYGPTSANTYGGEAWVSTTFNYNTGQDYIVDFRWGADVNANHIDGFAIQIANGLIPLDNRLFWVIDDSPGVKNLYSVIGISPPDHAIPGQLDLPPTSWSIYVDGLNKTATLYDGPNLSGTIIGQKLLDPNEPWYVRFIHTDATSGGFPAGDNSLFLYHFTSQVVDDEPPVILCPSPITVAADGNCGATIPDLRGQVVASDNCTPPDRLTFAQNPAPGAPVGLGTAIITVTVSDEAGNTTPCTTSFVVADRTPPLIVCPGDVTVACSPMLLVPVTYTATAADNCDLSPTVTFDPPSGTGFAVGTTTVTCTAKDASGNESTCAFQVIRAALGFAGFLPPIDRADVTGGSFASPVRTFKWKSTIPV